MRQAPDPRIPLEVALVRLTRRRRPMARSTPSPSGWNGSKVCSAPTPAGRRPDRHRRPRLARRRRRSNPTDPPPSPGGAAPPPSPPSPPAGGPGRPMRRERCSPRIRPSGRSAAPAARTEPARPAPPPRPAAEARPATGPPDARPPSDVADRAAAGALTRERLTLAWADAVLPRLSGLAKAHVQRGPVPRGRRPDRGVRPSQRGSSP